MSKRKTKHIKAYRTHLGSNIEHFLVINLKNKNWWWLPCHNNSIHDMIEGLEDPTRGVSTRELYFKITLTNKIRICL